MLLSHVSKPLCTCFRLADQRIWSAADFGSVVCPVAGGEPLPGEGDVGVDAEGAGKDCCRDLGGELEQCGAASGTGADAESILTVE
jgi:hypothetical protein